MNHLSGFFAAIAFFAVLLGGCGTWLDAGRWHAVKAAPLKIERMRRIEAMRAASEASTLREQQDLAQLEKFARKAAYVDRGDGDWEGRITPPDANTVAAIQRCRDGGRTEHLSPLIEYGLLHHALNLERTGIARKLDVESNIGLAELVRLLKLPEVRTASEGGWLDAQFDGRFVPGGWSSYQLYTEVELRGPSWRDSLKGEERVNDLLGRIRTSGRVGIGGNGVCHYGCH